MESHQMKYQFTQKAKDRKQELIKEFEAQVKASRKERKRLHKICVDEVPLFEQLLELDTELEPHKDLTQESWEVVYISHGWVKEDLIIKDPREFENDDMPSFTSLAERLRDFEHKKKNPHFINPKKDKRALYIEDIYNIDNWQRMDRRTSTSERLLKVFKEASFDLSLLDRHQTLYQHEGFYILLGLCPDIEKRYIAQWDMNATNFKDEDGFIEKGGLGESGRDYDEWKWVEREFKTKKRQLSRQERSNMSENELHNHIVVPIDIDKEQFIGWAKGLGYIKENTALRDVEEAPFKAEFSKMLYDQLIEKDCINGDLEGKWIWLKETGAYSHLVRMLHVNTIPTEYHTEESSNQIKWANLEHYIHVDYKGHPKDYRTTRQDAVIEEVVTYLLEGYNNTDRRHLKYP
ncbi:MAG: hypothetical protein P8I88_03395 [Candidatus Thioglobus sp.]|nr:hypothetical protein [Candidatus Thioglobus sp.]MDG1956070.1 hypothetical protein [Candidatus Thioglobus sp.]